MGLVWPCIRSSFFRRLSTSQKNLPKPGRFFFAPKSNEKGSRLNERGVIGHYLRLACERKGDCTKFDAVDRWKGGGEKFFLAAHLTRCKVDGTLYSVS